MSAASSRYIKEFHRLAKNLDKKTDGQASLHTFEPSNLSQFTIEIAPKAGPYQHGKFLFQVLIPSSYPDDHPDIICLTDIYHPNVDTDVLDDHNICLNLFDEWNRSFGLEDCIQGLLFLFYHPNINDPISGFFDGNIEWDVFQKNVTKSLNGESVDGYSFAKNHGFLDRDKTICLSDIIDNNSDLTQSDTSDGSGVFLSVKEIKDNQVSDIYCESKGCADDSGLISEIESSSTSGNYSGFANPQFERPARPPTPTLEILSAVGSSLSDEDDELSDKWMYRIVLDSPDLYRRHSLIEDYLEDEGNLEIEADAFGQRCVESDSEDDLWNFEDESSDGELPEYIGNVYRRQLHVSHGHESRQLNYEECDLSHLVATSNEGSREDANDLDNVAVCQDFVASRFIYADTQDEVSYIDENDNSDSCSSGATSTEEMIFEPTDRMRIVRRGHTELIVLTDDTISMEIARGHGRLDNIVIRNGGFTRVLQFRSSNDSFFTSLLHMWHSMNAAFRMEHLSSSFFNYLWPLNNADGGHVVTGAMLVTALLRCLLFLQPISVESFL